MLRASALDSVPHGFCTKLDHEHEPEADWIAAGSKLVLLKQVHSGEAIPVTAPFAAEERPQVDGMATATPGLTLGIVTADCAPVLFADSTAGVIGAAHAGWRGAFGGVLEATIAQMEQLGASRGNIAAAIGPTIAQASYEVDKGFRETFLQEASENTRFFAAGREGHFQFDLPAYVAARLQETGIGSVQDLAEDTYTQPDRFHSFRRATHLGAPTYGRQYSLIALPQ